MTHKEHPLATYRKGLCIKILSSKEWAEAQGSRATASTQTGTEGGFGPASRNQRSLGPRPGPDLLQLARGEQAGFLHTRHNISELIPSINCLPICFLAPLRRLGSELNLDTEFPHFTDGWKKALGMGEAGAGVETEPHRRSGLISHRGRVR